MRCPSSTSEVRKNGQIPPSLDFCPIQAFSGLMMPSHIVKCNLLYRVYQIKCSSHLVKPLQTHTEIMFNLGSQGMSS